MPRPAHISLTMRCHRSVSVFRLASKASFLPWTRSFRLGIRRSKKGADDTFTSWKEEKGWIITAQCQDKLSILYEECFLWKPSQIFNLTSKSLYCATSTYPGRPSVSRKSRRWVMAIFPTPRLVLTEEDSLKTHSLGSMCSRTDAGRHTWKSEKKKSANFSQEGREIVAYLLMFDLFTALQSDVDTI